MKAIKTEDNNFTFKCKDCNMLFEVKESLRNDVKACPACISINVDVATYETID